VNNYKEGGSIMGTPLTKPAKKETTARKKNTLPIVIVIIAFLLITAGFIAYQQYQAAKLEAARLEDAYQKAISVKEAGDYGTAANLFMELGDYKDSPDMIQECYDAQSLENLQSIYRTIDTMYQMDNKLVDIVSTAISKVDTINSAGTKLRATPSLVISSLYSGQGHRAYAECSVFDLANVTAYFPSAQVSQGRLFYDVYIPIFSTETAQTFVDTIESANTLMKDFEEEINTENVSAMYQEIQEQLLLTYESLKEYHSFVANKPTDYENYDTTAMQKKAVVSNLLENLPSTVTANK